MATQNLVTAIEGMGKAAYAFETTSSEFRSTSSSVGSSLSDLNHSWKGEAAMKFQAAMAQWQDLFAGVIRELDGMQERMVASAKEYGAGETEALEQVDGFGSAMPQGLQGI